MTPFEYVMQKLTEEGSELAMAASELAQQANSLSRLCSKTMLFGANSAHPDHPLLNNRSLILRDLTTINRQLQRVTDELEDVNAVAAVLRHQEEFGIDVNQRLKLDELVLDCSPDQLRRMQVKLRKWAKYVPSYLIRRQDGVAHVEVQSSSFGLKAYIEQVIEEIESLLKAKNDGFSL